jgi:signal transduction histidine kinase
VRLGLRLKFILLISTILLVIFGLTAFFMVRNVRTSLNNNVNQESRAFAALATKPIGDAYTLYKDSGTVRIRQEIDKFLDLNTNVSNVTVVDISGTVLFTRDTKVPAHISAERANSFEAAYATNKGGEIIRVVQPYFDDAGQHSYAVVYDISTEAVEQTIHNQELNILIFAILGLLLSAVATYEFVNTFFLRPIQEVSQMSGVIAAGYYSQQIELHRQDEIGALAGSVNRMASALKANIAELKEIDKVKNEFIMITSHNLRTPLTIIEGNLSMLQRVKLEDQMQKMVTGIEQSARKLHTFAEQMLTIASIEAGNSLGEFTAVKLTDVLDVLENEFRPLAVSKNQNLEISIADPAIIVKADQRQLTGALRNLFDNAFKFTPENGKVSIAVRQDEHHAMVDITDSGIGIKAEELPKIFSKFHRGTSTLTYDYEGTGIGLYVAKLIVEQHKGSITATSQEGHGSTFTVTLPLAQQEQQPNLTQA